MALHIVIISIILVFTAVSDARTAVACSTGMHCRSGCMTLPGYGTLCDSLTFPCERREDWYGPYCNETVCPHYCDWCDLYDGQCRCEDTRTGPTCNLPCHPTCPHHCDYDTDTATVVCTYCPDGYYGATCDELCPSNCGSNRCYMSGACDDTVDRDKICKPGFISRYCNITCAADNCQSCDESPPHGCTHCMDGYYGDACELQCPGSCTNGRCNAKDGTCGDHSTFMNSFEACKPGYTGWHCNISCSITNCEDCDEGTPATCLQCLDGYLGEHCEHPCEHCEQNVTYGNPCEAAYDGTCVGCKPGYYGSWCELPCPPGCGDQRCHKHTGKCSSHCVAGSYGEFCSLPCKGHCRNDVCDKEYGNCTQGCKPGYFTYKHYLQYFSHVTSQECSYQCPENCREALCNETGYCTYGCQLGYYGPSCNIRCDIKCYLGICEQDTGECCSQGKYGENCNQKCSQNCEDDFCNMVTGGCSEGCKDGYAGLNCEFPCYQNCMDSVCDQEDGACIAGCEAGWFGEKCKSECSGCERCDQTTGACPVAQTTTSSAREPENTGNIQATVSVLKLQVAGQDRVALITVGILGALLAIAIAVAITFGTLWLRQQKTTTKTPTASDQVATIAAPGHTFNNRAYTPVTQDIPQVHVQPQAHAQPQVHVQPQTPAYDYVRPLREDYLHPSPHSLIINNNLCKVEDGQNFYEQID